MDIFIVIIIMIIVVAIGYILSRPFMSGSKAVHEAPAIVNDYQFQYQMLLKEIKSLQTECEENHCPEDITSQLEQKKRVAANILRKINPPIDDEIPNDRMADTTDQLSKESDQHTSKVGAYFCPQCGNQVISSDKFCTHCGKRLQP